MLTRRTAVAALGATAFFSGGRSAFSQTKKVRVAEVFRSQLYAPMYVAIGKGFAKDEGLEIELISAGGSDRVGALVLAEGCDIGLAGPEVPVYIYNGESPDKQLTFCALTGTDGYYLVSKVKIEKFDWRLLNGKKILGHRPGSTPQLCFEYLLKQKGIDSETLKSVVTNVGISARDGAWIGGGFDFGIFFEPSVSRFEKGGQAFPVASVGKELGRVEYTTFFAKQSWLKTNGETAQKWTNAIAKAQAWMGTAKTVEVAEVVGRFFPGISNEDQISTIDRYRNSGAPIWASGPEVDRAGIEKLQDIMISGGVLPADKKVSYEAIVTTQYSSRAQALITK